METNTFDDLSKPKRRPQPPPPRRIRSADYGEVCRVSLIEQYNLTSLVREMRRKGKSYRDITDYINDNKLCPNEYKLSYGSVVRWCQRNDLTGRVEDTSDRSINLYNENLKLLNTVLVARERVELMLEEYDKKIKSGKASANELNTLIAALDRLTLRQQTISSTLADMQERVYKYETVSRVVEQIMSIVSVNLPEETYNDIVEMLRADPILCAAVDGIAPTVMSK